MQELGKKLIQWFSLDTDEGVAAIEYAVIAGLMIGGILVWAFY
jgi:Flp pilus assembly pilin Flp